MTRGMGLEAGDQGCGRLRSSAAYRPTAAVSAASGMAAPSVGGHCQSKNDLVARTHYEV